MLCSETVLQIRNNVESKIAHDEVPTNYEGYVWSRRVFISGG